MREAVQAGRCAPWQAPVGVLAAALLFNLGQGVAIGWLRMMADSGHILGPAVMGALADAMDLSTPFLAGALLVALAWRCWRQTSARSASTQVS